MSNFLKNAARRTLYALERVLPARVYRGIYRIAFDAYRRGLRRVYFERVLAARAAGSQSRRRRVEHVYAVMPHSLVGAGGLEQTYDLCDAALSSAVPGAFVECGVAGGGSAALLAMAAQHVEPARKCWFFDSYEGLPEPTDKDFQAGRTGDHVRPLPKGSCLGTLEQVSRLLFETFRLSREDVTLVKGWFQDTLPATRRQIGSIAVLRLDGDWYDSTKCCLENLYDQVADGGYVIIDDYHTCFGCRRAVDEFLAARGLHYELTPDGRGGCSFQKPQPQATAAIAA
jgi:O-methyltransferase